MNVKEWTSTLTSCFKYYPLNHDRSISLHHSLQATYFRLKKAAREAAVRRSQTTLASLKVAQQTADQNFGAKQRAVEML